MAYKEQFGIDNFTETKNKCVFRGTEVVNIKG